MPDPPIPMPPRRWLRRILFAACAFFVATVLCLAGFAYYWLYLPVGSGPAGPKVVREQFAKAWSDRPVFLLGLGDSVTDGYGVDNAHSYFGRLVSNPSDDPEDIQGIHLGKVFPKLQSMNLARSGSDSLQHVETQLPKIPVQSSDVLGIVVITTGGNDIIHNYGRTPPREGAMYGATFEQARPWIANFETRLNKILDEIAVNFPGGCHIFLANIYDPTDGTGGAATLGFAPWPDCLIIHGAYNEIIVRAAEQRDNVHLVDIHSLFLGHGLDCRKFWRKHYRSDDPNFWYLDILEDPNSRGYDALRRLFLIEIAKVFQGTNAATSNTSPTPPPLR